MPRRQQVSRQVGNGPERDLIVTFEDDPPERAEAVRFFQRLRRPIFPAMNLPDVIDRLSLEEAQRYLDANPLQQRWSLLRILPEDGVMDDDLSRLQFISELDHLSLYNVGDGAIKHITYLHSIDCLVVYSKKVTDACLEHVRQLVTLRSIDFQGAPNVSPVAFAEAVAALPRIVNVYPPYSEDADRLKIRQR
jgi:hypothetical protein